MNYRDRDKKPERRRRPRNGCWLCDGSGRCRAVATKKSVTCKECGGTGVNGEQQ